MKKVFLSILFLAAILMAPTISMAGVGFSFEFYGPAPAYYYYSAPAYGYYAEPAPVRVYRYYDYDSDYYYRPYYRHDYHHRWHHRDWDDRY
ncbi:MAG: hypothetical protein ACP5SH_08800 [Syntrophobacteraceae bacterium]